LQGFETGDGSESFCANGTWRIQSLCLPLQDFCKPSHPLLGQTVLMATEQDQLVVEQGSTEEVGWLRSAVAVGAVGRLDGKCLATCVKNN